jgi:hypothetical protein
MSNTDTTPEPHSETAGSVTEPVITADLVAVVAAFTGFLDAGEADRAAALWDVPALILGDTHVHGPLSLERVASWLRHVSDGAREDAVAGHAIDDRESPSEALIVRVDWVAARVASVQTRWPRRPRGGLLAGVDGTTFLIRVDQFGQAKIRGLLLHSKGQRALGVEQESHVLGIFAPCTLC